MPVIVNKDSGLAENLPEADARAASNAGTHDIPLMDPQGQPVSAAPADVPGLLKAGHTQPDANALTGLLEHAHYNSTGQKVKAGLEGIASGIAGPLAPMAEKAMGVSDNDINKRREYNSGIHAIGEGVGLAGSMMTGIGEGALLTKVGTSAEKLLARTLGEGGLAKLGTATAKGAVENALFASGDEVSKMITSNPEQSVETALSNIGMSAALGGLAGGAFHGASVAWDGAMEGKANKFIEGFKTKVADLTSEPKLPEVPTEMAPVADKGSMDIRNVANGYAKRELPSKQGLAEIDPEFSKKIADAYDSMPHAPDSPEVKKSYDALIKETNEQFEHIKKLGIKIEEIKPGMENPYKNSGDLLKDVQNRHMWYYPTESGFGTGDAAGHPLLQQSGKSLNGKPLLANDVFRIVHDIFGHVKEGVSFGARGEESAWLQHRQMYSAEAQKALATETRGQNSWVNFGPKGAANRANPAMTTFAEQKAGILPEWAQKPKGELPATATKTKMVKDPFTGKMREIKTGLTKPGQSNATNPFGGMDSKAPGAASAGSPFGDTFKQESVKLPKLDSDAAPTDLTPNAKVTVKETPIVAPKGSADIKLGEALAEKLAGLGLEKMAGMIGAAAGSLVGHPFAGYAIGQYAAKPLLEKVLPALTQRLANAPISGAGLRTAVNYAMQVVKGDNALTGAAKAVFSGAKIETARMSAEELASFKHKLDLVNSNPSILLATEDKLGHYMPDHAELLARKIASNAQFLHSLRPDTAPQNPLDKQRVPNAVEVAKYNNALNIAERPMLIMAKIQKGNLSIDDIGLMKHLHPELYNSMVQKLNNELIAHVSDKGTIPYHQRVTLSAFMHQPMDSTLTPMAIQANQMVFMQQQQAPQPPKNAGKLDKLPQMDMTPQQSRSSRSMR